MGTWSSLKFPEHRNSCAVHRLPFPLRSNDNRWSRSLSGAKTCLLKLNPAIKERTLRHEIYDIDKDQKVLVRDICMLIHYMLPYFQDNPSILCRHKKLSSFSHHLLFHCVPKLWEICQPFVCWQPNNTWSTTCIFNELVHINLKKHKCVVQIKCLIK